MHSFYDHVASTGKHNASPPDKRSKRTTSHESRHSTDSYDNELEVVGGRHAAPKQVENISSGSNSSTAIQIKSHKGIEGH